MEQLDLDAKDGCPPPLPPHVHYRHHQHHRLAHPPARPIRSATMRGGHGGVWERGSGQTATGTTKKIVALTACEAPCDSGWVIRLEYLLSFVAVRACAATCSAAG